MITIALRSEKTLELTKEEYEELKELLGEVTYIPTPYPVYPPQPVYIPPQPLLPPQPPNIPYRPPVPYCG